MDENSSAELANSQAFEDELQSTLKSILASDDSRRGAFQLIYEEEQQNIVVRYFFTILCSSYYYYYYYYYYYFPNLGVGTRTLGLNIGALDVGVELLL